eukprot:gene19556-biopygen14519
MDRLGPGKTTTMLSFEPLREGSEKWATGEGKERERRRLVHENIVIGIWNVRTLRQTGKMEVLVEEMNTLNWNVLGIAEMRWRGIGEGITSDGHKFWFCGNDKSIRGVGFLVN